MTSMVDCFSLNTHALCSLLLKKATISVQKPTNYLATILSISNADMKKGAESLHQVLDIDGCMSALQIQRQLSLTMLPVREPRCQTGGKPQQQLRFCSCRKRPGKHRQTRE